jgi:Tfp pilus assembly protein PilF
MESLRERGFVMSRFRSVLILLILAAILPWAHRAEAQVGSQMRGKVVDVDGQPIPDVKAEFIFRGESRVPIVKVGKTDKKGQYVRVGLQSGNWEITFTKEGFKPRTINTYLSGDALSETPPVTMDRAAAGSAAKEQQRMKELGAVYKTALEAMTAGDHAKAEAGFKEVLAANPNIPEAHHNLGYVYMLQNKGDEAEASFRKAIEIDPNKGDSYLAVATLLGAKGQVSEAFDLLSGVALLFGQDPKFQFTFGVAASNAAKDDVALTAFNKVLELEPTNIDCLFYLGTLATSRNDIPAATDYLRKYVAGAAADALNVPTAKALLEALTKSKAKKK